jgi:uncharacterized cupredoxin-like copper-binding protein
LTGCALVVAAAICVSVRPALAGHVPVAKAVIWPNLVITVAPKSVSLGRVVFKIKNRDIKSHQLLIDGIESVNIGPDKTASLVVTFKRTGIYSVTLSATSESEIGANNPGGFVKVKR